MTKGEIELYYLETKYANTTYHVTTLRALYGFLYAYVDKSARAWYEDGLMTYYTSN